MTTPVLGARASTRAPSTESQPQHIPRRGPSPSPAIPPAPSERDKDSQSVPTTRSRRAAQPGRGTHGVGCEDAV